MPCTKSHILIAFVDGLHTFLSAHVNFLVACALFLHSLVGSHCFVFYQSFFFYFLFMFPFIGIGLLPYWVRLHRIAAASAAVVAATTSGFRSLCGVLIHVTWIRLFCGPICEKIYDAITTHVISQSVIHPIYSTHIGNNTSVCVCVSCMYADNHTNGWQFDDDTPCEPYTRYKLIVVCAISFNNNNNETPHSENCSLHTDRNNK